LFISHDISLVKSIADRIGVLYLGKFMEIASTDRLFEQPLHPYTESLLSSIPTLKEREERFKPNVDPPSGEIPSPANPPSGCVFHTRCPKKEPQCEADVPTEFEPEPGHSTWCHVVESELEDLAQNPEDPQRPRSDHPEE
jgi:peptide/nickel transport system ATP-binding protein/oligopeptide transport system ATP-binding protein